MTNVKVPEVRTSERTLFRKCRQAWWWGYRQGLVPKGTPAIHFWFGTGVHEALATWYQPGTRRTKGRLHPVAVWQRYCDDELVNIKTKEGDITQYVDAVQLGTVMLENYLEKYGRDEHMHILVTEQTRRIPIYDHDGNLICYYLYTMDGSYRDLADHNRIKILEHKTALMIILTHLTLDDQAGSYLAFETLVQRAAGVLREDEAIMDITYNFLRKATPKEDDRPRNVEGLALNKDGSVSKNQGTQAPLLVRHDVSRSAEARHNIIDRLIVEVKEMNACRADPENHVYKNPMPGPFGCSSCPFKDMCELHEEGGDWQDLRDWQFDRKDPYGPYRKVA